MLYIPSQTHEGVKRPAMISGLSQARKRECYSLPHLKGNEKMMTNTVVSDKK
jgi:hypothetical protein